MTYSLHNKRFVPVQNDHGVSTADTIFQYYQVEDRISGTYQGGHIQIGHLVGRQTAEDEIALLYHCLTDTGELLAGESVGKITRDAKGLLHLHFRWNWLNGDRSGGESFYQELL